MKDERFMRRCIELSREALEAGAKQVLAGTPLWMLGSDARNADQDRRS